MGSSSMQPDSAPTVDTIDNQLASLKEAANNSTKAKGVPQTGNPSQIIQDDIELLKPEYRNVAGHVRRTQQSNTSMAQPPPRNPQRATLARPLRPSDSQKRGKGTLRDGDNSDSESDRDSNRKRQRDEDGGTLRSPRPRKTEPGDMPQRLMPNYDEEDAKRMKLHRVLKDIESEGKRIRESRAHNRRQAPKWKADLVSHVSQHETLRTPCEEEDSQIQKEKMLGNIRAWQSKMQTFLDEALYGDVEEKLLEEGQSGIGAGKPLDYLEDVLLQVESGIYQRCSNCGFYAPNDADSQALMGDELDLVATVVAFCRNLWCYVSGIRDVNKQSITAAASRFVEKNCNSSKDTRVARDIKALEDAYMLTLRDGFVDMFLKDRQFLWRPRGEQSLESVRAIRFSRRKGHLTSEYMDWAISAADLEEVEKCCARMQQEIRAETIRTYKETMRSVTEITQEFCPNLVRPGLVSLVLFKGSYAATIRDVSDAELREMGWHIDQRAELRYWRYTVDERVDGQSGIAKMTIFKISMDDEVMGMWVPYGLEHADIHDSQSCGAKWC
ncbi:hypothetical protein NM208_g2863 [Fusarium decemcellulare]|uniref:Uncharacterized protein n=1 Tax=Fusarium decemcellulare TaxID=57161 RepID=A0ACC1SRI0_9HYPO|nr:hypothetical protein NM208_g2863 [Fusarium decemcellulare]